ncbi:ribonuclease E inhibitor RraB [Lysobacter sp. OAE881]|uniref:ribonuclease E inhibitor RraB n=1 Tax=Lysobacter sp. OAE881 TaxID=2663813 RepID=UPI0019FF806F
MTTDFPSDENGQVLRQMAEGGDDLSKPRNIDFTVVLPGESEALAFAKHFKEQGYEVKYRRSDVVEKLPWDVTVVKYMIPDHGQIDAFEDELQQKANALGGRNDGWGCFAQ